MPVPPHRAFTACSTRAWPRIRAPKYGALGIAVIGSVFASVYGSRVAGAVSGLSDVRAGEVERSLGEALRVSNDVGGEAGQRIAHQATAAFDTAAQVGFLVAAALTLAGAIVALLTIRRTQSATQN